MQPYRSGHGYLLTPVSLLGKKRPNDQTLWSAPVSAVTRRCLETITIWVGVAMAPTRGPLMHSGGLAEEQPLYAVIRLRARDRRDVVRWHHEPARDAVLDCPIATQIILRLRARLVTAVVLLQASLAAARAWSCV